MNLSSYYEKLQAEYSMLCSFTEYDVNTAPFTIILKKVGPRTDGLMGSWLEIDYLASIKNLEIEINKIKYKYLLLLL